MNQDYIHGFSAAEQRHLLEQADILAPKVFAGVDYSGVRNLLEIGCGVGAELKQVARRWPRVRLTLPTTALAPRSGGPTAPTPLVPDLPTWPLPQD